MRCPDIVLVALLAAAAPGARAAVPIVGPLMVSDPATTPQPSDGDAVLSMTVTNNGDVTDHLIRAACPVAGSVTFAAPDNGGSDQTHPVDGFEIPARKAVAFGPGQWQIVLHHISRAIAASDVLPCTVTFEKSGEQIVQVGVAAAGPS